MSAAPGLELFSLSPALFVQNQGQWADETIDFVQQGAGVNVAMTDDGVRFQMFRAVESETTAADPAALPTVPVYDDPLFDDLAETPIEAIQFSASFVGANQVAPVGLDQAETVFNYCVGAQEDWRTEVPSYEIVAYENLYDGIDLQTWGLRSHLKYEFHVTPGADYHPIQIHYDGIAGLSLGENGELLIDLGDNWGQLIDDAPYIYQTIDGQQVEVAGRFVLIDSQTYAFELTGPYDATRELVIDPELTWSGFLGGSGEDTGWGVAIDGDGNVLVAGDTKSPSDWISGGYDTTFGYGTYDAFVVKLNAAGDHLWSTYVGGSGDDRAYGVAVDSGDNVLVTGRTGSSGWVSGGDDTTHGGYNDAFVVKLASDGGHLWSTYLGGLNHDYGNGIAVDSADNVLVTGETGSSGWVSLGDDATVDGSYDAFAVKLSTDGEHVWSTYLGGTGPDRGYGVATDANGDVLVTGTTESSGWVSGGYDTTYGGGRYGDAFVVKLGPDGGHLWSTYLGASGTDRGRAVAVDSAGSVLIAGDTDWGTGGMVDAFVVKLGAAGGHLWTSYLGGSGEDNAYGLAVDRDGNALVAGSTQSPGWVSGGFDTTLDGYGDVYVAKLGSDGGRIWSTYLGGTGYDYAYGLAVDRFGNVVVTGQTDTSGWVLGAYDTTYDGNKDAFVVRIGTQVWSDRAGAAASTFDPASGAFDVASSAWAAEGGAMLGGGEGESTFSYTFYLPPSTVLAAEMATLSVSVYGKGDPLAAKPELYFGPSGARISAGELPENEGWHTYAYWGADARALLTPIGDGSAGSMLEVVIDAGAGERYDLRQIRVWYDYPSVSVRALEAYQGSGGGASALAAFGEVVGAAWDEGTLTPDAMAEGIRTTVSRAMSLLNPYSGVYLDALEALKPLLMEYEALVQSVPPDLDWNAFWATEAMASCPDVRPALLSTSDALAALSQEWLAGCTDGVIEVPEALSIASRSDAAVAQMTALESTIRVVRDHVTQVLTGDDPAIRDCARVALRALSPLMQFDVETGADLSGSYLPALRQELERLFPNVPPSDIFLSGSTIPENSPAGTTIGTLGAIDANAGDTFTFSLVDGAGSEGNASFQITDNRLWAPSKLDHETLGTCSIRVRATDQTGLSMERVLAVAVTDVNEAPTAIRLANSAIAENQPAGTLVGTLTTTDPDVGDTFTYTITDGADLFVVDGDQLRTVATFDYEDLGRHTIHIRSTDRGGLYVDWSLTIDVLDMDDILFSNNVVPQDPAPGTVVGTFTTTLPPGSDNVIAFVDGAGDDDNGRFEIDGGALKTIAGYDYGTKPINTVRVRTSLDNGIAIESAFAVVVTDIPGVVLLNDVVPEKLNAYKPYYVEVGAFVTVGLPGTSYTYSLVSGMHDTDNDHFDISPRGVLRTAAPLDYEAENSYIIRVRATSDIGATIETGLMVYVSDVNETPTGIALSDAVIEENSSPGTLVGFLTTTDPDVTDTFTYTLVSGTGSSDNGSFIISDNRLRAIAAFDYENQSSLSVRVRATDQGGRYIEEILPVNVTNVNEPPTDIAISAFPILENQGSGRIAGSVAATDPDGGALFTYSFVDGEGSEDNGSLALVGAMLRTAASFDYEAQSCLHVRVRATDLGGLYVEKALTLDITDVNEQPTAVVLDGNTVAEGLPPDTSIGSFSTIDPDFGGTFSYALVGGEGGEDNAWFTISGNELRTAVGFDQDVQNWFSIRVRSTDQGGLYVENSFLIQVVEDTLAPTVTGVVMDGTGWAAGLGGGFAVSTGSGEQLLPLPWEGIDRISIGFSEDVLVDQDDLALYGVNVPQYDIGAGTFAYDPLTFTATWTLAAPLEADRLSLCLNADGEDPVRDAAGNQLDGEWTNPAGTSAPAADTFPSGDGTPGGDFTFHLNVLPGDADRSGTVDAADMAAISAAMATTAGPGSPLDVARDGAVAYSDMYAVHQRLGHELPAESVSPVIAATDPELTAQPLAATPETPAAATGVGALELFSLSPALFVQNQGQWADDTIDFVHQGAGVNVAMTNDAVRFQMFRAVESETTAADPAPLPGDPLSADPLYDDPAETPIEAIQFSASFVGANQVAPVGLDQAETVFNYCVGAQEDWRTEVPSYEIVAYENLYDGIDLQTWGLRSHLKYEFHVTPGADYHPIQIHYDGIAGLSLGENGELLIDLGDNWGQLIDDAPYIYQTIDGQQVEVAGRFVLIDSQTYSFELTGPYDASRELVIDPDVEWSTYLGGSGADFGIGLAVDSVGDVLVTGATRSSGWVSGGFDTTHNNGTDAFVVKISASGEHLWSTYLGGGDNDSGYDVAIDSGGSVLVAGRTVSSGWVSCGFDTTYGGGSSDAFVAKLSPSGGHLWSTYLGDNDADNAEGVAVDSADNVLIVGFTESLGWVSGGYDTGRSGVSDGFVAKLSSEGAHLWSTYLGGASYDLASDVAVDSGDSLLVVGYGGPSDWVSGGYDLTYGGETYDAFVVKLGPEGQHVWSTFLGGTGTEYGHGIAVDPGDDVLVTGLTGSSGWVSGGFDTALDGYRDGYVVKLSSTGEHVWSTYLGDDIDEGWDVTVDFTGSVLVAGEGGSKAYVAKLSSMGEDLWSIRLEGHTDECAYAVAVDALGNVVVTGDTRTAGWVSGGFDTTFNSDFDGYVAWITIVGVVLSSNSVAENEPAGSAIGSFAVIAPDFATTLSLSLVSGNGDTDNGLFSIDGNVLATAAAIDYESGASRSIRVRMTDEGGRYTEKVFVVNVTDVNDQPTDIALSGNSVLEDRPPGIIIGSFSSSDPDVGQTFNYALVDGEGSDDNAMFAIDGDALVSAATFDFESKTSHSIRVRSTDQGGMYVEKVFAIDVTDVNISLSKNTLPENQAAGTTVGSLTTLDLPGSTFSFSLVSGDGSTGNAYFSITGNALRTAAVLDYEACSSYSVRVRSTNEVELSSEQVFVVNVTDVNEPPFDIVLSNSTVAERQPNGTVIGSLSTEDPDVGNTFTYSLVSGVGSTNNSWFSLSGGVLKTANSLDYETANTCFIRVRATDQGGLFFEKALTISVTDLNESPTDILLSSDSIPEGQPAGTVVGWFSTIDQDFDNTFVYSLVDGSGSADNAEFVVDGDALTTTAEFDFEARRYYGIRIRSTDQDGLYTENAWTIDVVNVNEAPTDLTLSNTLVREDQSAGTVVGSFSTTDPDSANTFFYSLVGGDGSTDNAQFAIEGDTLRTVATLDYETQNSYAIRVRATDHGGLYVEKALTVSVADTGELSFANQVVPQNPPPDTVVGTFATSDPRGSAWTYALVAGTGDADNAWFAIDGNALTTVAGQDYETRTNFTVRVRSTDEGGLYVEKMFAVVLTPFPDIVLPSHVVPENQPAGTTVGNLVTVGQPGTSIAYSLVDGTHSTDNEWFTISGDTLKTAASFDREAKSSYIIRVRSTSDSGLVMETGLMINVSDVNEAPTNVALSNTALPEDLPPATLAGFLVATDPDVKNTWTYSLVEGTGSTDNGLFVISGNRLRTVRSLDHESKDNLSIRVRATDQDGLYTEKVLSLSVTDVNEPPADIVVLGTAVAENLEPGALAGTIHAMDPDSGSVFTYALVDGAGDHDNGALTIASGSLLRTATTLDYEAQSCLHVRLRATDQGGLYTEKALTINIADVNETPTDIVLSNTSIRENEPTETPIGRLTATDPDAGDTAAFSLIDGPGSADNGQFAIVGDDLVAAACFDHEAQDSFTVRVRATDQGGLAVEKVFSISVSDVNEQPTEVTLLGDSVVENQPVGTLVGLLGTTDPDAGDAFAYTFVDGPGSDGNALFAIDGDHLATAAVLHRDVAESHSIRVRATDAGGLSVESIFVVRVEDTAAPAVTSVVVGGTSWAGSPAGGFPIPTGSGEQLLPLPWTGIDQLAIAFSENVLVDQNDLTLYGLTVPQYDIDAGTFAYDPLTFTATWTLAAPLEADRLTLCLNADGESPIQDAAGNRLDGEWTNPADDFAQAADTFPSGDGTPGGDLMFRFNVLPGDADQNGDIDAADRTAILPQIGHTASPNNPLDIDGNGVIAYADMYAVHQHAGQALPAESVSPAVEAVDMAVGAVSQALAARTPAVVAAPKLDQEPTAIAAATIAPIPTTIPPDPLPNARRAAAHDAVLAAAARQDSEAPAGSLVRWDWVGWYDLEQLRQHKRESNREHLADAPHRDLRHAMLR